MAGVESSEFDCPVCLNFFTTPKLLPCHHLVCQSCVLSWIQSTGGQGRCPVCRAPILTDTFPSSQLQAQVDRLPTDLATQALAESHKILSDPHHCGMCQNVDGQDFCMECSIKLCTTCTKYHHKLPATSQHTVQQLSTLTVKQLAVRHQVKCQIHTRELAQLFCTSHSKLICFRCGATTHHACPELREVKDAAKEERRKLQDQLERLEVKVRNLAQQVDNVKEHIKVMRKTAQDTFDDLSHRVEKRRCDVLNLIQSQEDAMKASLKKMENARVSTALPIRNISNLVLESPDVGLLEIHQNLVSRLDNLESRMKVKPDTRDVGRLVFDDQTLTRLQSDLAQLGKIQQPTSGPAAGATATTSATASGQRQSQVGPTTAAGATATTSATASGHTGQSQQQGGRTSAAEATPTSAWNRLWGLFSGPKTAPKPQGAALARVLKVGDRVKVAPEGAWLYRWWIHPGDTGTVTAIPSRRVAAWGRDPQGWVDVKWDRGREFCHRMGCDDHYQLILS